MTATKTQQQAIQHRKGNVLVSAGAGSGKTKVLTERVLNLVLNHGIELNHLLILTFTNAAANQMKDRIRQALILAGQERQAEEIDSAFIMTFDAFALYLVRQHYHLLGVSPTVGIFEQTLYEIERKVTLKQLFNEGYEKKPPAFIDLIRTYVINQDETLIDFILNIDAKADLKPNKEAYLDEYISTHYDPNWYQEKEGAYFLFLKEQITLIQQQASFFESAEQTDWFKHTCQSLVTQPDLTALLVALKHLNIPRLKPKSVSEDDKILRNQLKKEFKTYQSKAEMLPLEDQRQRYHNTKDHVATMIQLIRELNQRLNEKKRQQQQYPFSDIAKMATLILKNQTTKTQLQAQFESIMIDEYQDTNDLQEDFLFQLQDANLFMVGDVKQSIYRFRNANSQLFQAKLKVYQPYLNQADGHQKVILMNQNFRSRPEVIDAINDLFTKIMTVDAGGVEYLRGHTLAAGQKLYSELKDPKQTYGIDVLRYEAPPLNKDQHEPLLIVQDIIQKMNSGLQVVDLESKTLRPIKFKDFAILIDRKTYFESYLEIFSQYGIPLEVFAERNLSNSDFFRVIKNLIALIVLADDGVNQEQLKHAYVSVLRSFLFQVEDDQIYRWVLGQISLDIIPLAPILKKYHQAKYHLSLHQLMDELMVDLQIEERLLTLPDLPSNLARLQGLMLRVKQLSDLGYTLEQFYEFLLQSDAIDVDLTIASPKETDNAVQLMTIHKSKGLEFPYVYYPGLTKGFNMVATKGVYQYAPTYGIQLPYPNAVYPKSFMVDLIFQEEKQAIISEQVRLFYVALTRAKEQIILVLESSRSKPLVDIKQATSFSDFFSLYESRSNHPKMVERLVDPLAKIPLLIQADSIQTQTELTFKRIEIEAKFIEPRRASKPLSDSIDESALEYGSYLHECLFLLDFNTMDTSFIPISSDRQRIDRLLKHPFFENLKAQLKQQKIKIYKEYAFQDPQLGQGVIDLLIIQGNQATIIDYKTNQLDDPAYINQVQHYARYLEQRGLVIQELYLVSLLQGVMKELKRA
jgi:ATP-dependent helicase/nuclease subunit A